MQTRIIFFGIIVLSLGSQLWAASYYVSPTGSGSGSKASPMSLTKANSTLLPGDIAYLRGGEYTAVQINPKHSGSSGKMITYIAYRGEKPVLAKPTGRTGILLEGKSYIVIDGIGIDGKKLYRESGVNEWAILQNNAHHNTVQNCDFKYAKGWAGFAIATGSHHNKVLNNTMDYCGAWDNGKAKNTDSGDLFSIGDGRHNLVEGNRMSRGGHLVFALRGRYNVVRNNVFENSWGENKGNRCMSISSVKSKVGYIGGWNLMEGNVLKNSQPASDNPTTTAASKLEGQSQIFRKNFLFGNFNFCLSTSASSSDVGQDNRIYNNVFYNNGGPIWATRGYPGYGPVVGNVFKNNLAYKTRQNPPKSKFDYDFILTPGDNRIISNSIIKNLPGDANVSLRDVGTGTLSSMESKFPNLFSKNIDGIPLFVKTDPKNPLDFALRVGSPQIDQGDFLTLTLSAGSGTVLPVRDAGYFCDGFEIVEGDRIQLSGSPTTAIIQKVDYVNNTLTLDRSMTWKRGEGVGLPYVGIKPDIGAHEFGLVSGSDASRGALPIK